MLQYIYVGGCMKKLGLIVLSLVLIFLVAGCERPSKDALRFKNEYESLNGVKNEENKRVRNITIPSVNPIVYKNANDIVKMINDKKTFVVYFGYAECPWCRSVIETLLSTAKELKLKELYYVDVQNIRDIKEVASDNSITTTKTGSVSYTKLLGLLDNVLSDYQIKDKNNNSVSALEKRIYAPNVIAIVDGKAIELETGISKKETNPYMKLTKAMKKETYNKFKCVIKCTLASSTTCTSKDSC